MLEPLNHKMVVGTSEPQDFQLYNEEDVPLVGTGVTVEIDWRGTDPVGSPGVTVAWLDATIGTVRVTDTEDMPVGLYRFRWKLTDSGGGRSGFIPNLDIEANYWRVARVCAAHSPHRRRRRQQRAQQQHEKPVAGRGGAWGLAEALLELAVGGVHISHGDSLAECY